MHLNIGYKGTTNLSENFFLLYFYQSLVTDDRSSGGEEAVRIKRRSPCHLVSLLQIFLKLLAGICLLCLPSSICSKTSG